MKQIPDDDLQHWYDHGYAIVRLLDDSEVDTALQNIYEYLPPWEDYARRRRWYAESISPYYGPGKTRFTFPYVGQTLNRTTLHPALVGFAETVLKTERIMLGHAQLEGKYALTRTYDQPLHCDFDNNMLVVPTPNSDPLLVAALLYYTDVTIELSPTYVVPQEFTGGGSLVPWERSKAEYPDLYEHEVAVTVPAGSALLYSMTTFHRGSALTANEGLRFSQNIGFKRLDTPWCGQVTFQHDGGRPEMDAFLQSATPREREFVGFPPVGNSYWNEAMLSEVRRRYPSMDTTPYEP